MDNRDTYRTDAEFLDAYFLAFGKLKKESMELWLDNNQLKKDLARKQKEIDALACLAKQSEFYVKENGNLKSLLALERAGHKKTKKELNTLRANRQELENKLACIQRKDRQRQETRNLMWICKAIFESPPLKA